MWSVFQCEEGCKGVRFEAPLEISWGRRVDGSGTEQGSRAYPDIETAEGVEGFVDQGEGVVLGGDGVGVWDDTARRILCRELLKSRRRTVSGRAGIDRCCAVSYRRSIIWLLGGWGVPCLLVLRRLLLPLAGLLLLRRIRSHRACRLRGTVRSGLIPWSKAGKT